jgi:hypothetical protein
VVSGACKHTKDDGCSLYSLDYERLSRFKYCVVAALCHNEDQLQQKVKPRQEMAKDVHSFIMQHKKTLKTHRCCHIWMGPVSVRDEISFHEEDCF